jgi:two-component system CheB/CheR fusion protein
MIEPASPVPALRIFVVENHADTLKWLTLYLQQLGHTVSSARSVAEALQALPKGSWDVFISDIGLPDGDGWELLKKAHLPHEVYTIAMSGFGMNADRSRSKTAGYRHHMLKPFDPEELDGLLAEAARESVPQP